METTMENEDVRALVSAHATRYRAPEQLADRIADALPPAPSRSGRGRSRFWQGAGMGAAATAALAIALGIAVTWTQVSPDERLVDEVVGNHVRSLQATHTVDVASSDQHTVKPWFNGKLDYAAPVVDLAADGFALEGGRLDYLDHREVAALVYRHRLHTINVFVMPTRSGGSDAARLFHRQGFSVERWTNDGMEFWAISDADPAAITQLRTLLTARTAAR
jgi:anti-sigma factor RsiW